MLKKLVMDKTWFDFLSPLCSASSLFPLLSPSVTQSHLVFKVNTAEAWFVYVLSL